MSLSTTDAIAIFEDIEGVDSAARLFKISSMPVSFNLNSNDDLDGILTLIDSEGGRAGANIYPLASSELTAQEATYTTALATVRAAVEKAIKARLDAIPSNSGKTITYT